MAELNYQGQSYTLDSNESVLDCLLRHGVNIPYSCKSGTCQSCLIQTRDTPPPDTAQRGLKATYKKRGLFLACQCHPNTDMTLFNADHAGCHTTATLLDTAQLNHSVLNVRLQTPEPFDCAPGQYITVINPHGVARSYSVANDPKQEGFMTLHVKLIPGGKMSHWLYTTAQSGDTLTIRGPAGACFYTPDDDTDHPIILAGTGTGLAPLYGIARDALAQGHQGPITLYHGALTLDDLYLVQELTALAASHNSFTYVPCVMQGDTPHAFYHIGDMKQVVLSHLPDNKAAVRLFLCGAPEMVTALKTQAFLKGVASKHIFADPFLPSKP